MIFRVGYYLFGIFVVLVVFSGVDAVGSAGQQPVLHRAPDDYVFRTDQVVASKEHRKTLWDYLSFFALPDKPDPSRQPVPAEEATELKMRVREIARQLLGNAGESIADEYAVIVNSFVNLNNLYLTSSLGRYVGEQLIGELQGAGVEVIDIRKSASLMVHERHGEYGLSRDMGELSYVHSAHATLVGTYMVARDQILINARLLSNMDGTVLSHGNVVFDLDPVTMAMLADEAMPLPEGSVIKVRSLPAASSAMAADELEQ